MRLWAREGVPCKPNACAEGCERLSRQRNDSSVVIECRGAVARDTAAQKTSQVETTIDEVAYILEDSGADLLFVGPYTAERGVDAQLEDDEVAQLLRWDAAARGDLSLDDLRQLPRRGDLGSRFCWEVALRLAALRERRSHDVPHAAADELHLPNRIGDALRVLEREIQQNLPSATEASPLPEPADGAWIRRCWPQLFASSHP